MIPMKKPAFTTFNPFRARTAWGVLFLSCLLIIPLNAQAGFWDGVLKFGKQVLATAAGNYANNYQQDLTQLLQALRQPGQANQPLNQGINPYGQQGAPYGANSEYETPYGQNQGYDQGYQQGGYGDQGQNAGYPTDPNYGYAQNNDNYYEQDQGYQDPNTPYENNSQYGGYEQDSGGYPQDPRYADSSGQGYHDPYNTQQGYPSDNSNPYAQNQGGNSPYPSDYENQGSPYDQGTHDPYQTTAPEQPYDSQYGQQQYQESDQNQYSTDHYASGSNTPYSEQNHGIQLDVAMVKKAEQNGAVTMIPIQDGEVLRDGRGNAQAGDKFRVMFRANSDCYVYVIAIDGSAWAQGIFPSPTDPFANPIKQGQQYTIPGNNNWLSLDQFKGIETLFFVASPEKRQDIEDILASIAGRERHPKATPQQVTQAPIIPAGYYRSQIAAKPFIIGQGSSNLQGQDPGLMPTTYFTQKAGDALRVTRWFRHE